MEMDARAVLDKIVRVGKVSSVDVENNRFIASRRASSLSLTLSLISSVCLSPLESQDKTDDLQINLEDRGD